ncbi:MAG TPA: ABC transporter substrate-binding protein [Candidatus Deferrimicrobium sp.]|nr:ABC transporter substrate-binding protein [Candidatus Deferrimicrobium sp.]
MSKKVVLLLSLLVFMFAVLTGCASNAPSASKPTANVTPAETTYPLTVKDDSNTDVTIPAKPMKIVSFVPSATETLFALGLEGRVIAVTKWDDYPTDVQKKVQFVFQDSLNPNNEQLLKLNPDLVIVGAIDDKTIQSLRNLKLTVLKVDPESLDTTYQSIEKLGLITNTQEQGKKIISGMKEKQAAIAKKVAAIKDADKVKVWVEVDPNFFTAGKDTFMDELISKAGGVNIAADAKGWTQYTAEKVIAKNPQIILTTYGYYVKNPVEQVLARNTWQNIDAIKNKRVFDIDSNIVTRPGPRIIDGLEIIAKALYPESFK